MYEMYLFIIFSGGKKKSREEQIIIIILSVANVPSQLFLDPLNTFPRLPNIDPEEKHCIV